MLNVFKSIFKGMNRRKQTRPKRTSCSENNCSVEESQENFSQLCSLNFSKRSESRTPPLMDGDENLSEDSCGEAEYRQPKDREGPAGAVASNVITVDINEMRSNSPHSSEFADQNSLSSPSGTECNESLTRFEKVVGNKCPGVRLSSCEIKSEEGEKAKSERKLSVSDCPSPVSGSGSEKDLVLRGSLREPAIGDHRVMVAPILMPSNPVDNNFFADEQNFVQKLESFVASMDRRTKLKPSASMCADKIISNEGFRSKTLNGAAKADGTLKYLYYDTSSRYIDGSLEQPLDLSVGAKDRPNGIAKMDTYGIPLLSNSAATEVNLGPSGSGTSSLLASLERKFGEHSQILDRIGTLPRACHFGGSLVLSKGSGFYSAKLPELSEQVHGCRKNFIFPSPVSISSSGLNLNENHLRMKDKTRKDPGKTFHHARDSIANIRNNSKSVLSKELEQMESTYPKKQKTTSLRCSCDMEFDRLYLLTVHLQETGHKPSSARGSCEATLDNTKLVRGQDVWLHNGSEQTRQILRCMECHRSFRSLPELTVHMIQTEHYMNLIQPELTPRRISAEPGSSSGSEGNDQFCCHFCSKVFEDADTLGLHIVNYGHYHQDVPQKLKAISSPEPCVSSRCSFSDQKDKKTGPVESSGKESVSDVGECSCADNDCQSEKLNPDLVSDFAAVYTNESGEVPIKFPRLERVQDLKPAVSANTSPSFSNESAPLGHGFYPPPSSQTDGPSDNSELPRLKPTNDRSDRSPPEGEATFVNAEPQDVLPDKESALKAMQSFINRSFGHSQESQAAKPGQLMDVGHQQMSHKSSLSMLPWPPAGSLMTKLTWTDNSLSRSRKRHHHDSDSCMNDSQTVSKNSDSLRLSNGNYCADLRTCHSKPSYCCSNSVSNADSLWKSTSRRPELGRDDHRVKCREDSPCCYPGESFRGIKAMGKPVTSPVMPSGVVSPLDDASSSRKLERSQEKDEKLSLRLERNGEMSTLDSLQDLVYNKSFKSLEKFIQPSASSYGQSTDKLSQSQALVISTKNSLKKALPETLILVNPIVTVMPSNTASGPGGSSLSITLPHHNSSDAEISKDIGILSHSPSMDTIDSDGEQYGEFKCLTCKRNFASKGSYRYHRSRYHAYSEMESSKMKDKINIYSHLSSEQTNKFSKYYQLASELSSKSN